MRKIGDEPTKFLKFLGLGPQKCLDTFFNLMPRYLNYLISRPAGVDNNNYASQSVRLSIY